MKTMIELADSLAYEARAVSTRGKTALAALGEAGRRGISKRRRRSDPLVVARGSRFET
jgi:hypothetical protein